MRERERRSIAGDVDELVTIAFVAKLAKWNHQRMWRRLKRLDREFGEGLLQNVSRGGKPHFLVGLRALKQAWPKLFAEDLDGLTDRVVRLEAAVDELAHADEALARELGTARKTFERKFEQLRLIA